jgi:hypothetical protein
LPAGSRAVTPIPATATATPTPTGYPIKVNFSRFPDTDANLTAVFPVVRISPTPEERAAGYYTELNGVLNGPSSCSAAPAPTGGPDFTLSLDHKGTNPEAGTATLRFCRAMLMPGEGTDGRIKAEIDATVLRFASIKKVVSLTQSGQCAFDLRTGNQCLK